MKLEPLDDRIVCKVSTAAEKSKGGIIIPDNAKERPQMGEVLAVGPGRVLDSGERLPVCVKVGQKIVFNSYGGHDVEVEGEEYRMLRESDVLAVLE